MGKMVKASIYIENVCAQTKVMNLSAPFFHSFFTCWKTGKSTFCEKLSVITRVDYFVLHICWWWVEKNIFFDFLDLNFLQTRIKWNIFIINVKTKADSRYNLLRIAIKNSLLRKVHQYIFSTLCNTLIAKIQSIRYAI